MIRVVEASRAALERRIVEMPLGRRELPDELVEVTQVFGVAGPAALGCEVELVPPLQLCWWRQRYHAGLLAADEVSTDRDQRLAALLPECGDDVGGPCPPVEAGEDRPL